MSRYLLDTTAAIALLNNDSKATTVIGQAEAVFLPIIAIGELYLGAENSSRVTENVSKVDQLVTKYPVLLCDLVTTREYARIDVQLRRKGQPVPQNDMWIAAIASQNSLTVLARDKHFTTVAIETGLPVVEW